MNLMQLKNFLIDLSRSWVPMTREDHGVILIAINKLVKRQRIFLPAASELCDVLIPYRTEYTGMEYDRMVDIIERFAGEHYTKVIHYGKTYILHRSTAAMYLDYSAADDAFMMDYIIESGGGFGTVMEWEDRV